MKAFTSTLALALLAAATGCGSLSGDANSERVLTTLHGQLDNPQSVALGGNNVRVAVIWRNVTDSNPFSVAEDLPVQPVFPSAFEIDITAPPPAAAMNSGSVLAGESGTDQTTGTTSNGSSSSSGPSGPETPTPSSGSGSSSASSASSASSHLHLSDVPDPSQIPADFQFAVGQVVAYQDVNQNGKLDLVNDGATSYTDQIVAANESLILIYLSGTLPSGASNFLTDTSGKNPTLGYNLYQIQTCEVTPGGSDNCNSGTQWFDMSTLYDLPVSNDPTLNELMCSDGGGTSSAGSNAVDPNACISQPGTAQASYPAASAIACSSDGSYFTTDACTTIDQGPCKGTLTSCTTSMVCRPSGVVPANWPCPATGN